MNPTTLTISADHPALAGHFPGVPIVPGVLLLDETLRALEEDESLALTHWRIGRAKFLKPVRPGETLLVEHESCPTARYASASRAPVSRSPRAYCYRPWRRRPAMASEPADSPLARARADSAQWAQARERGSATLVALGVFLALRIGRPLARLGLHLIAAYFFVFAPTARHWARDYLRRVLGREPTAADRYRQVYAFASTILDRLYLLKGRDELFEVSSEGDALMLDTVARHQGVFLLGSHLGSFALVSSVGGQRAGVKVAMAMYDAQAGLLMSVFNAIDAPRAPEIIPLGHLEAMLRIRDCLEEGKFVGMLADRTIGDAPAQIVPFLGAPALFPSGPMRVAAALRRPVIFMTGLYRGGNRYHAVFRQIADFSQPCPRGREAAVREGDRTLCAAPGGVLPLGPLQLVQLLRLLARRASAG